MGFRATELADKAADYRRKSNLYSTTTTTITTNTTNRPSSTYVKPQQTTGSGSLFDSAGINIADQVDAAATLMAMPTLGLSSDVSHSGRKKG